MIKKLPVPQYLIASIHVLQVPKQSYKSNLIIYAVLLDENTVVILHCIIHNDLSNMTYLTSKACFKRTMLTNY